MLIPPGVAKNILRIYPGGNSVSYSHLSKKDAAN